MKRPLTIIIFLFLVIGCDLIEKKQNDFLTLEGITNGLKDGTQIYLVDKLLRTVVDSTSTNRNKFEFKRKLKNFPSKMVVQTKYLSQYKFFWAENKHMVFDASNSDFRFAKITGSELQSLADQLKNVTDTMEDREKRQQLEVKFVEENPNSLQSASMLSVYSVVWKKSKVEELYNRFSKENKESVYGEKIRKTLKINKVNPQIGEKYVDFQMENDKGKNIHLSEYLGKVTLLDFWASWCGPCRKKNVNLVKTYNKFNKNGFEIFAVSLDQNEDSWKKAIKDDKLNWIHASDLEGRLNKAGLIYGVNGIPDNFLLNQNGEIVGRNLRGEQLDIDIAKLLNLH